MGYVVLYVFIYISIYLGAGLGFGFGTKSIAERKGYTSNWFWFGFFCGAIGLIVAACITENRSPYYSSDSSSLLGNNVPEGSWRCTCGRINPDYTGTCACGREKPEESIVASSARGEEKARILNSGGWICMKCKKAIPSNIGFCTSCGMSRGESRKIYDQLYGKKEETAETPGEEKAASQTTEASSQAASPAPAQAAAQAPLDKFEEIKKYKELLDQDIITREEFEKKKKELLL